MTRKPRGLTGQMEQLIESALAPGRFISYKGNSDFVGNLEAAEKRIASLAPSASALAGSLYETFLAGCHVSLRAVYLARKNVDAYAALGEATELTALDCRAQPI